MGRSIYLRIFLLISGILLAGCGSGEKNLKDEPDYGTYWTAWENTEVGEIRGTILLQWVSPDWFIYVPDETNPLTFIRKKDSQVIDVITPNQKFYTDGGSTPRLAQASEEYSPWKFAPAYIVHDWLFLMKHCGLPGAEKYDHLIAARILAEAIKTQMMATLSEPTAFDLDYNKVLLHNIYVPVKLFSEDHWENREGRCDLYIERERTNEAD